MYPVALIDFCLTLRNKLGHNLDNNYIFPQNSAKFEFFRIPYQRRTEEDEEINDNICPQTDNQTENTEFNN